MVTDPRQHNPNPKCKRAGVFTKCAPLLVATMILWASGCHRPLRDSTATSQPATQPIYDTTLPKPVAPRDRLERTVVNRGADLRLMDRWLDPRTLPQPFDRRPLASRPAGAEFARGHALLDDENPFPDETPLPPKEISINVGICRSTYKTREPEEVLSAAQPFVDLAQRQVNVRGAPVLHESADEAYYALLEGREQLTLASVFDYLMIRSWLQDNPDNGTILLGWAQPRSQRVTDGDRDTPGPAGAAIELIVAAGAPFKTFADLRDKRLALAANVVPAPGAFLTRLLTDAGHPADSPYFATVALRRYPKDALLDVLKGKADVACVDQGTVASVTRFYGLGSKLRTLAVSPRYGFDVMFSSVNNLRTHQTEIELTQQQLNTLGKDPEGQEVLFFFDTEGWKFYREGDIDVALAHFADYVRFIQQTPIDLKPLLDPTAPIDRRTYDRLGDE